MYVKIYMYIFKGYQKINFIYTKFIYIPYYYIYYIVYINFIYLYKIYLLSAFDFQMPNK